MYRTLSLIRAIAAVGLVGAALSCDDGVTVCTRELSEEITPTAATLLVGQELRPEYRVGSCGNPPSQLVQITLRPEAPGIVETIDTGSALRAIAPGATSVTVVDRNFEVGQIAITVVPPG